MLSLPNSYIVGGFVRDSILGIESKDIDIEVFGLSLSSLEDRLKKACEKVSLVGESFGVFKVVYRGQDYDVSIPRRENKVGIGHRGFDVKVDPTMTIEEAALRRDFTINAISMRDGIIVDPFKGKEDLKNRVLRHVGPQFSEDPLRVLRGFQFCGRFDLIASPGTLSLCRNLKNEFDSIPKDRVWTEFEKWALKSTNPKAGLDFLAQTWIGCFPQLRNMLGCPQDNTWHPEGCVYTHTAWVCNAMNDICGRENITGNNKLVLMLAALCHDMGKAETTCIRKGRISSPGHDKVGADIAKEFLLSIRCPNKIIAQVVPLVRHHMDHINGINENMARRLSVKLFPASIKHLVWVMEADHSGRPPLKKDSPAKELGVIADNLGILNDKLLPIMMGRHFEFDGPELGKLLAWLFEKQQAGRFNSVEDGMRLARRHEIFHRNKK